MIKIVILYVTKYYSPLPYKHATTHPPEKKTFSKNLSSKTMTVMLTVEIIN